LNETKFHQKTLFKRYGIDLSKNVSVLIYVNLFKGMKREYGNITKEYTELEYAYPSDLLLSEYEPLKDIKFEEKFNVPINKQYKINTEVICLNKKYFGFIGRIIGYEGNTLNLEITKNKLNQIKYPTEEMNKFKTMLNEKYVPIKDVLKKLNVQKYKTIDKITDMMIIKYKKVVYNVGLGIKDYSANLKLVGYTKKKFMILPNEKTYYLNTSLERRNAKSKFSTVI
jgi:hypothetical protein